MNVFRRVVFLGWVALATGSSVACDDTGPDAAADTADASSPEPTTDASPSSFPEAGTQDGSTPPDGDAAAAHDASSQPFVDGSAVPSDASATLDAAVASDDASGPPPSDGGDTTDASVALDASNETPPDARAPSVPDASASPGADAARPRGKRVFVTSIRYTGDLGGIAGADEICAAHADSVLLQGEFRAWLSTIDSPVASRLQHSPEPYLRLDGVLVAQNWDDLIDGTLAAPINLDEAGTPVSGDVWTGTRSDGSAYDGSDCAGFETATGDMALCGTTSSSSSTWTENSLPSCGTSLRVYCLEQ